MIYDHPLAGINAYRLFEDLSEFYSVNGRVHLYKSMRSEDTPEGERKYPPIYEIELEPNRWEQVDSEVVAKLEAIAEKHDVKMTIVILHQSRSRISDSIGFHFKHR